MLINIKAIKASAANIIFQNIYFYLKTASQCKLHHNCVHLRATTKKERTSENGPRLLK